MSRSLTRCRKGALSLLQQAGLEGRTLRDPDSQISQARHNRLRVEVQAAIAYLERHVFPMHGNSLEDKGPLTLALPEGRTPPVGERAPVKLGPLPTQCREEGTRERYPQVRSSSSMRTFSGAWTKAILTPGRMVRGGTVKTAPRWVSSVYAASMLSTRSPK